MTKNVTLARPAGTSNHLTYLHVLAVADADGDCNFSCRQAVLDFLDQTSDDWKTLQDLVGAVVVVFGKTIKTI